MKNKAHEVKLEQMNNELKKKKIEEENNNKQRLSYNEKE